MNHAEYCDELAIEVNRFADALALADPSARAPSCPDWTVKDLTSHLGMVHRWATRLVRERSPCRISFSEIERGGDAIDAQWLRVGGAALVASLRDADPDEPMWAWGVDQHVRFWSRRQLHETFVHRLDLELATGADSYIDAGVALDAIDEFLANMRGDRDISLSAREDRDSELFRITSTAPCAQWTARLRGDGYDFVDSPDEADAELSGPAGDVLRVLLRRSHRSNTDVAVSGDETLVEYWLTQSAFR
ncbi:MAG: maleylpyruvate isomerase family mycothiol-dependent enzyme [Acidimicrobiales bacterium]